MRVAVLGGTVFIGRAIVNELVAELVRVPNDAVPDDLGVTGHMAQHFLVSSDKARRLLGYTDTPRSEAMAATVAWHLENPPPDSPDGDPGFEADDTALARAL